MSILTIDGHAMPSPTGAVLSVSDVKSAPTRTADGTAVARAPALKRSLQLRWSALSAAEFSTLWTAAGAESVTLALAGIGQIDCLTPQRSAAVLSARDGQLVWTDVEMRFEEK